MISEKKPKYGKSRSYRPEAQECPSCGRFLERSHILWCKDLIFMSGPESVVSWVYRCPEPACVSGQVRYSSQEAERLHLKYRRYSREVTIKLGYRRSGDFIYRPHCTGCEECRPCRIPVAQFSPRRNQQRCLKSNQDLSLNIVKAHYSDEYFELYRDYLNARHGDGEMSNPVPDDFEKFLYSDWSNTYFLEARKDERLLAVAVTDVTPSGLSAVYTYFDPAESKRGLGNFCILQQIHHTQLMQLDHLYMGYWINDCQKMK